jgi:hypothetical protein
MKKMTLEQHAKMPASKAHGKNAKGFKKGGKTDADMLKYGRGMAKAMNQKVAP